MNELVPFAAFGVWSLICVLFGAWLMYRKRTGQTPNVAPDLTNRLKQLMSRGGAEEDEPDEKPKNPRERFDPGKLHSGNTPSGIIADGGTNES